MDNVVRDVGATMIPCNWLQCMENSVDPTHAEYLHGGFFKYCLEELERQGRPHPNWTLAMSSRSCGTRKIDFERHKYGIIKKRLLAGDAETTDDWRLGHPLIFPDKVRIPVLGTGAAFQIRVPIDDTTTWHLEYEVCFPPDGAGSSAGRGAAVRPSPPEQLDDSRTTSWRRTCWPGRPRDL